MLAQPQAKMSLYRSSQTLHLNVCTAIHGIKFTNSQNPHLNSFDVLLSQKISSNYIRGE